MKIIKEFSRDEIKFLYLIEFENFGEKFWKIGISKNGVIERYRYKGKSNMLYRAKVIFEIPMLAEDAILQEKWVKEKYKQYRYTPTREFAGSKTEVFSVLPTVTLDSRLLNDNLSFRGDIPPQITPIISKYKETQPKEEDYYEVIEVDETYKSKSIYLEENLEDLEDALYKERGYDIIEEVKTQDKETTIVKKKSLPRDKIITNSMERRYLDKGMFVTSKELGKGEVITITEDDRCSIIYFKKVDSEILCDLQYRKGIYNSTEAFKFYMSEEDMPKEIRDKKIAQRKDKEYWKKRSKRRGY